MERLLLALFFSCVSFWFAQPTYSEIPAVLTVGSPADRAADFDQLWHEVSQNYVYLGDKADSWAGGFDGLHRAIVVGTPLGRLNGSVEAVTLEHTRVVVKIPEEQIFHVSGVARHEWNPPVLVDLVATRGQADPELAMAENVLKDQLARGRLRN